MLPPAALPDPVQLGSVPHLIPEASSSPPFLLGHSESPNLPIWEALKCTSKAEMSSYPHDALHSMGLRIVRAQDGLLSHQ